MILADIEIEKIAGLTGVGLMLSIAANFILVIDRNKAQKREVTFAGTPVDKKDFDAAIQERKEELIRCHERIDEIQPVIAAMQADIAGVKAQTTLINQNVCQLSSDVHTAMRRRHE